MKGTPAAFELQMQYLKAMYEEKIPFNKILGFEVETLRVSKVVVRFAMRADLIGNYVLETLHGGVISALVDSGTLEHARRRGIPSAEDE